jgi:hypothetical protein
MSPVSEPFLVPFRVVYDGQVKDGLGYLTKMPACSPATDHEAGLYVIRTAAEWESRLALLQPGHFWRSPPDVDWGAEMLLLYVLGRRSSSGYEPMIQSVLFRGDSGTSVRALEIRAGSMAVMHWLTVPFQAVVVPSRPGPAELVETIAAFD